MSGKQKGYSIKDEWEYLVHWVYLRCRYAQLGAKKEHFPLVDYR